MRLYGVLNDLKDLIKFSYIFEGILVLYETLVTQKIKLNEGLLVSLFCFIIIIYLFYY
jgi:hypothetical protein